MNKFVLALILTLSMTGSAIAHGSISKLPDTVQILQYKMKLYMNTDDADTKNNLAMAYFRAGQYAEAKQELHSILQNDVNNFDALDGMSVVLIKEGDGRQALEFLTRAQAVNKQDLLLHVHLSLAHELTGQPDKASAEMKKATSMAGHPEELSQIDQEISFLKSP